MSLKENEKPVFRLNDKSKTKLFFYVDRDPTKNATIILPQVYDPNNDDVTVSFQELPGELWYDEIANSF